MVSIVSKNIPLTTVTTIVITMCTKTLKLQQQADTGEILVALEALTEEDENIGVAGVSIAIFILENVMSSNITCTRPKQNCEYVQYLHFNNGLVWL